MPPELKPDPELGSTLKTEELPATQLMPLKPNLVTLDLAQLTACGELGLLTPNVQLLVEMEPELPPVLKPSLPKMEEPLVLTQATTLSPRPVILELAVVL